MDVFEEYGNHLDTLAFRVVFEVRLAFCFILYNHLCRSTTLPFVQRHPLVNCLTS